MFPKVNPTETQAWKALAAHYVDMKTVRMKNLFEQDPDRFTRMSIGFDELLFDYSKNIITAETLEKLLKLADDCKLKIDRKSVV